MLCKCGSETKVTNSRVSSRGRTVTRRRECLECGERFTTWETCTNPVRKKKKKEPEVTEAEQKTIDIEALIRRGYRSKYGVHKGEKK